MVWSTLDTDMIVTIMLRLSQRGSWRNRLLKELLCQGTTLKCWEKFGRSTKNLEVTH